MTTAEGLTIDAIELEPTLEELDVPVGAVAGRSSRVMPLAIGLLGAIVGYLAFARA